MRERTPPRQIESEQFAQKLLERLAAQNIPGESLPVIFAGDQRAGGKDRPADGDERPRPRLLPEHRKPLARRLPSSGTRSVSRTAPISHESAVYAPASSPYAYSVLPPPTSSTPTSPRRRNPRTAPIKE